MDDSDTNMPNRSRAKTARSHRRRGTLRSKKSSLKRRSKSRKRSSKAHSPRYKGSWLKGWLGRDKPASKVSEVPIYVEDRSNDWKTKKVKDLKEQNIQIGDVLIIGLGKPIVFNGRKVKSIPVVLNEEEVKSIKSHGAEQFVKDFKAFIKDFNATFIKFVKIVYSDETIQDSKDGDAVILESGPKKYLIFPIKEALEQPRGTNLYLIKSSKIPGYFKDEDSINTYLKQLKTNHMIR